jgi:hypothetical protein
MIATVGPVGAETQAVNTVIAEITEAVKTAFRINRVISNLK